MTQVSVRYPQLESRLLHRDHRTKIYVIERPKDDPSIPTWCPRPNERRWLFGDVNYAVRNTDALDVRAFDSEAGNVPGRWLSVRVTSEPCSLEFTTDRLGIAWLYFAAVAGGYIFASDFGAVAAQLKSSLTVDIDTALIELAGGNSYDEATVFEEIGLLPPDSIVKMTPEGLRTTRRRPVEYGDRYAGATREEKFRVLDSLYEAVVDEVVKPFDSDLVLSLSAGYDSRYALARLQKASIEPSLCTFGEPASTEVARASEIASRLGRSTSLFTFAESRWSDWRARVHQLGNGAMIQWSGWAEPWLSFLRQHGRAVVIGYLGDALTGKHLLPGSDGERDWLEEWLSWVVGKGWGRSELLRPRARERLPELLRERMASSLRGASFAFDYQKAVHLDMIGRQRRRVASQPNLISSFLTPVLFFYHEEFIDFWSNVPLDDMLGQKLYLDYARSRFPDLFHSDEGAPPAFSKRLVRGASRLLDALILRAPAQRKSSVVDHRRILAENRANILTLARGVGPLVDEVIDVDRFCVSVSKSELPNLSTYDVIRAVNLLLLLDLCNRS